MEIFRPMCKAMLLPPLLILEPPGNADLLTQNEALVGLTSTEILYEESGSSYPLCAISMVFFVCVLFFFKHLFIMAASGLGGALWASCPAACGILVT